MKNQNLDPKNLKTSANSNIRKDKSLLVGRIFVCSNSLPDDF